MSTLALGNQAARWYPLIAHPVQLELIKAVDNGVRFPLVPAGRRSGKTERFKRFVVKKAMKQPGLYFAGAPTYNQAKKIFWQDLKKLSLSSAFPKRPSESELQIFMPNGAEIHIVGFDKPERFEGIPWTGGGIDEFANIKEGAWEENILPALNTVNPTMPDFRAWCWLFGVPDGLNHYYDLCQKAETGVDPNFKVFHWKSAEILPPDVIASMKLAMGPRQFRQEFEASFETATGRIYEDYSKANHTDRTLQPHEQIHWFHDFNFTPMSSGIGVRDGASIHIVDEIILTSAVARQSALEFVEKYKAHKNRRVLVYGDPAGKAGEKHGHKSDYTEIEAVLLDHGWSFDRRVKSKAPAIRDRQNAVRAKILNAAGQSSLFVNPAKANYCDKGLATVQLKPGSTFLEEEGEYQHITTAIGYMVDYEWPIHRPIVAPRVSFPS